MMQLGRFLNEDSLKRAYPAYLYMHVCVEKKQPNIIFVSYLGVNEYVFPGVDYQIN